jgi:hypothetical protein
VFEPEIFGFPSSAIWAFAQALLTPALGFLFVYFLRLPLAEISVLPPAYKYPSWVLPIFAHGSLFVLVALVSTIVTLNRFPDADLSNEVSPQLFLSREMSIGDDLPTRASFILKKYDGHSDIRILVNGYHAFSSDRDCVAKYQCTDKAEWANKELEEFKTLRVSGGSIYDLMRTNDLPHEVLLNHYLSHGDNYIDIISENSGTGGCQLELAIVIATERKRHNHAIAISPLRGTPPHASGPMLEEETMYSGGPVAGGNIIEPYKISKFDRRNAVCQRVRLKLRLNEAQAEALSSYKDFSSYFENLHRSYLCHTIGSPMQGCEAIR